MNPSTREALRSSAPWRSLLYVPVLQERFIRKAMQTPADAIQLDLEDSIAPDHKNEARAALPHAADALASTGVDVVVRVNHPPRLLIRDLEACTRRSVRAVALPKVAGAAQVQMVDDILTELEQERELPSGGIGLIAMVETTAGLLDAPDIARASDRLMALTVGTEDFALSAGVQPSAELMSGVTQQMVYAARAAGLWPLGLVGSPARFDDLGSFRRIARQSRRIGCVGAAAIHPSQVPVLNEEFTPTRREVDAARRLLTAYDDAVCRGQGAVAVDGHMVDAPIAARARLLVQAAERHRARAARREEPHD